MNGQELYEQWRKHARSQGATPYDWHEMSVAEAKAWDDLAEWLRGGQLTRVIHSPEVKS